MKGVIFDFNGTLFWDTHFHSRAFDIFMERYNVRFSEEEKRQKIYGKSNIDIMHAIFGCVLSREESHRDAVEKELIYQDLCRDCVEFAPGAEAFFEFLRKRDIPFTIGSSVGVENMNFYYEHLDMAKWFPRERIVYNDGTYRGKPAPDIFLAAAGKIGLPMYDIAVFEDSPAGIKAAENAGAGKIYIVDSNGDDYSRFPYRIIRNFMDVAADFSD